MVTLSKHRAMAVSYTHLDVYKRQLVYNGSAGELGFLEKSLSMTHTLSVSGKTFNALADTIPLGKFTSFRTIISIGDIFLSLGLFMLCLLYTSRCV